MSVLRDISFAHPEDNLLFDQTLLEVAESGDSGEVLRFWEAQDYFIVLGRIGRPEQELHIAAAKADQVPVFRRCSGGGTVVQGAGCLNYACVLDKEKNPAVADLRRSYQYILGNVTAALQKCGIKAQYLPISDIALVDGQRKISGNAQKRGRRFILHHGTLLYKFDLSFIERYLAMPPSMPDYREHRNHLDFVSNVSLDVAQFKQTLAGIFGALDTEEGVRKTERARMEQLRALRQTIVEP